MKMENATGYQESFDSTLAWLWALLFGCLYFLFKRCWGHAIISLLLALVTFGLSHIVYCLFARTIVYNNYRRNGWKEVAGADDAYDWKLHAQSNSSQSQKPIVFMATAEAEVWDEKPNRENMGEHLKAEARILKDVIDGERILLNEVRVDESTALWEAARAEALRDGWCLHLPPELPSMRVLAMIKVGIDRAGMTKGRAACAANKIHAQSNSSQSQKPGFSSVCRTYNDRGYSTTTCTFRY